MKMRLLAAAAVVAVVGFTGCNMSKESVPGLTGPSTLGRSVTLTAAPDRILYDGSSQATITATVRKADGSIDAGVGLRWEAAVVQVVGGSQTTTVVPVEPSPQTSVTGTNGTTTTVVKAPVAPDVMPSGLMFLQIYAVPIGDDAQTLAPGVDAKPRMIQVELVPVAGANAPDRLPVVDFLISPLVANIGETVTFDASLTRDEGVICGDNCTYTWDFGTNSKVLTGRIVKLPFLTPGLKSVRLVVTDSRGFSATKTQTFNINMPALPVADFDRFPESPRLNSAATFDASKTTVGLGAQIVSYVWDFGDGSGPNAGNKVQQHTFTALPTLPATTYAVSLIVTDDLGRMSQKTVSVTILP